MAFDEEIAKKVKNKYGIDVNGSGQWWKCEELWKDPEFSPYFRTVYDERVVLHVKLTYGLGMRNWWEHKELFSDTVYGSYFAALQRASLAEICDILSQPNSYRLVEGGFLPNFSKPESPKSVGIIPVFSR